MNDSVAAKIVFSSGYDEKASDYETVLGDRFDVVERLKAVYDWALLFNEVSNDSLPLL